jgi:transposase
MGVSEFRSALSADRNHVLAAERLHGDDKTVPVLAKAKTGTGRTWTYVQDDRLFGWPAPPAAIFHYSRDRRGEHPVSHLLSWRGILQAHAYAGYNALFHGDRLLAPLTRALCWSDARRYFFELADIAPSSRSVARRPSSRSWPAVNQSAVSRFDGS